MSPRAAYRVAVVSTAALCTMHGVAVCDEQHGLVLLHVGLWLAMLVGMSIGRMRGELRRAGRWP